MQATIFNIESRERQGVSHFANLDDFTYTQGKPVDPQEIINNPNVSLYCLDETQQQAIFTELPPGIDLSQKPFYYQAQFDNARQLIAVPYDTLHELGKQFDVDTSRLILIHNMGRCGSTLLNQVFNHLDGVMSLSEADVFSGFVTLRYHNQSVLAQLLQTCLRLVFRPLAVGQVSTYGLKFRNQCVDIMDLYAAAFPQARHLFLYRNVLDWTASLNRLVSRHGPRPAITRPEAITRLAAYHNRTVEQVEPFFDLALESYSPVTYLATSWLVMMDRYLELYNQGMAPLAVRYEDLNTHREGVLTAIFDYCGLPRAAVQVALQAFTRDSQRGTRLAREDPDRSNTLLLSDEQIEQLRAVLSRHPIVQTPDFVLPGTLTVS